MERKVWLKFDIRQFAFTKMQLERFKVLMGPRYKENQFEQQITVDMHNNLGDNVEKAEEIFYELLIESKRAP